MEAYVFNQKAQDKMMSIVSDHFKKFNKAELLKFFEGKEDLMDGFYVLWSEKIGAPIVGSDDGVPNFWCTEDNGGPLLIAFNTYGMINKMFCIAFDVVHEGPISFDDAIVLDYYKMVDFLKFLSKSHGNHVIKFGCQDEDGITIGELARAYDECKVNLAGDFAFPDAFCMWCENPKKTGEIRIEGDGYDYSASDVGDVYHKLLYCFALYIIDEFGITTKTISELIKES